MVLWLYYSFSWGNSLFPKVSNEFTEKEGLYFRPFFLLKGEHQIGIDNHKIAHIYSITPNLSRLAYNLNWMFDKHVDDSDPKEKTSSKSIGPKK